MSDKKKRNRPATPPGEGTGESEVGGGAASLGPPPSDNPMDVRLLEQIVRLMAANDLNTVDVRDGDKRVIVKRGAPGPTFTTGGFAPMPSFAAAPPLPSQPTGAASAPASGAGAAPSADESAAFTPVKAEMVGTFYASPKPGEKPFVTVGSNVDEDTEVCLIEAMKNFFAVRAGVRGTIAKVLVQDGETVQFDQPLFLVRPR